MKIRKVAIVTSMLCMAFGVACAHKRIAAKVNLMNKAGGKTLAISSSSSEALAYEGAKEKAEEYCFRRNKNYVVLTEKADYQGGDKTVRGIAGAVGGLFGKRTNSNSIDDYRVKMEFQCEGAYTGHGEPFADTL